MNGRPVDVRDLGETATDEAGRQLRIREETHDGRRFRVLDDPSQVGLQQTRFTVEPGRFFVMGDNRPISSVGAIKADKILGKIL